MPGQVLAAPLLPSVVGAAAAAALPLLGLVVSPAVGHLQVPLFPASLTVPASLSALAVASLAVSVLPLVPAASFVASAAFVAAFDIVAFACRSLFLRCSLCHHNPYRHIRRQSSAAV